MLSCTQPEWRDEEYRDTTMKIQIYEHVHVDDVRFSVRAGVNFIGVKPGEKGQSEGEVDFACCRALYAAVPPESGILCNALTTATDTTDIVPMVQAVQPDLLHLSGNIELTPPAWVAAIRQLIAPVKVMAAIPVVDVGSVPLALSYQGAADYLLLDTPAVDGNVGATGHTHDLAVSAEIVRRVHLPVLLAGGLHSGNVAAAIRRVQPWGVDSFTHTNRVHTRRKDETLVAAFTEAARGTL